MIRWTQTRPTAKRHMQSAKQPKGEPSTRIKAAKASVHGVLMPCEYVVNARGWVKLVMLADVELEGPGVKGRWKKTIDDAALDAFDRIEPCRKLAILEPSGQPPNVRYAFRQVLKRDISSASSSTSEGTGDFAADRTAGLRSTTRSDIVLA